MKTSIFALFAFLSITHGAEILMLSPMGSKSHKIFFMGIVKVLAERGHEVTVVSSFKESKPMKNVKDVVIPGAKVTELLSNIFEEGVAENILKDLIQESPRICNEGLATKEVQNLKNNKYDVVLLSMFFSNCYLSLIHHFKAPFVYISPGGLFAHFSLMIGNIEIPSIAANKILEASVFPLSFSQRFSTVILNNLFAGFYQYYLNPRMESQCREKGVCPLDMPSFSSFDQNASFAIINSIRALDCPPRPIMPNVIYAGGAHLRPGKPLPQELENWVQGSGDAGFIFFSLGSAVKPTALPEKYRNTLVHVFGKLKQRILWKWDEETMPDLPPNVKLSKWLPQQDILAHSKLQIFITHGGGLSTMESSYHGVPILGVPIYADQFSNINEAVDEGWAKLLLWKNMNEYSLKMAIDEILNDKKLRKVAKKRSILMNDRPIHPAEEAAFWIEYTVRHNGAEHLRSPVFQLSWYELHNLDVWGVIIFLIIFILFVFFMIIKFMLRCCSGSRKTSTKNGKKKKE